MSTFDNRRKTEPRASTLGKTPELGSKRASSPPDPVALRNEKQNSQLRYVSLSPRIIELDEQIKANQEKPKVKTQKDVSNIAQIFTLGVASNRQTPLLINPEEMSQ